MGLNVLVADDSAVMRAMILRTLRLSGIPLSSVHEASNGAEALDVIDRYSIDLALVDLNMPVLGGEDLLVRLRADPRTNRLPVVVVSTESSERRCVRLREYGVAFVHKPFTPETLRDTIMEMAGGIHASWSGDGAAARSGPDF